jgi:hypothetical protein
MKIQPKTLEEAENLIFDILNQGDSRYNNFKEEELLASFLLNQDIFLDEVSIPFINKPSPEELIQHSIQKEEKYIAKFLLKLQGFNDKEIFYEMELKGSRPDVYAEKEATSIIVECCSCRVSKIIDFLSEVQEVWILTRGETPWEEKPLFEKMKWFIFRKGLTWEKAYLQLTKNKLEELKKIPSPIDNL